MHCRIRWTTANLVDNAAVRRLAAADVIYCRNVFIYFADETIARVARAFAAGLPDDGYLVLGAAESLTRLDTGLELDEVGGAFAYTKGSTSKKQHDRDAGTGPRNFIPGRHG